MAKCETQSSSALLEILPCLQRKRRICLARSQVRRCDPTSLLYKLSVQHSVQQSLPQLNCYRTCHLRKDANQSNLRKITLLYDIMPALPVAGEVVSHTRCRDVVSPCSDTTVGSPEVGGSYFTLDGVADRKFNRSLDCFVGIAELYPKPPDVLQATASLEGTSGKFTYVILPGNESVLMAEAMQRRDWWRPVEKGAPNNFWWGGNGQRVGWQDYQRGMQSSQCRCTS